MIASFSISLPLLHACSSSKIVAAALSGLELKIKDLKIIFINFKFKFRNNPENRQVAAERRRPRAGGRVPKSAAAVKRRLYASALRGGALCAFNTPPVAVTIFVAAAVRGLCVIARHLEMRF